ncbi:hypothetical protein BESB_060930 [Besnoitia besnoiti]|uniref:Uncharacterized protein n=1 Tax=Besnoitia besnoiti TaxID=94643 RepID=A0A2A9MGW9_BESBE|nr:hypothetical protein BESB_060930 [Besnoitia besnoiti]PFH35206.1 hypothetical protein BESB_060930 [Besnoitia besnoiti]
MSTDLLADIDASSIFDSLRADGVLEIPEAEEQSEVDKKQDESGSKADAEEEPPREDVKPAEPSGEADTGDVKPSGGASGVDQSHLDKKTGLNKFRDLERQREEERKHHQKELEEEKAKRSAYTGKKWEVTSTAGPVRPQEAGHRVEGAVKSSKGKRSAREEIEEQTRLARDKRQLEHSAASEVPVGAAASSSDAAPGESTTPDEPSLHNIAAAAAPQEEAQGGESDSARAEASEKLKPEDGTADAAAQEGGAAEPQEQAAGAGEASEDAAADASKKETEVANRASVASVSRSGSCQESAEEKPASKANKKKFPVFFACFNKKGAKEPTRMQKSTISIRAVPSGEAEARDPACGTPPAEAEGAEASKGVDFSDQPASKAEEQAAEPAEEEAKQRVEAQDGTAEQEQQAPESEKHDRAPEQEDAQDKKPQDGEEEKEQAAEEVKEQVGAQAAPEQDEKGQAALEEEKQAGEPQEAA